MEYPKPFMAVQHLCAYTHSLEVVDNIGLNALQSGLGSLQIVCINSECEILGLHKTVVTSGELVLQHLSIFLSNAVEFITLGRDRNTLSKGLLRSCQVHKGKLELNGAVKVIQEVTPTIENLLLIFVAGKLIVDVSELDGFCIMRIAHPADTIRAHTQIRNAVLGGDFFLIRFFRS